MTQLSHIRLIFPNHVSRFKYHPYNPGNIAATAQIMKFLTARFPPFLSWFPIYFFQTHSSALHCRPSLHCSITVCGQCSEERHRTTGTLVCNVWHLGYLPGRKGRPARKSWQPHSHFWADCLEKMREPRRLTNLWAFTVCYRIARIRFDSRPGRQFWDKLFMIFLSPFKNFKLYHHFFLHPSQFIIH
jgi:hypothetical protein